MTGPSTTGRRPSITSVRGLAVLATAVLAMTACSGNSGSDQPAGAPNTSATACGVADSLTFATTTPSPTLDPAMINQAASLFLQPAYEPLIRRSPEGEYVPGLATEWGYVGEGNKEFRLVLREGVTFSDGAELTAEGLKKHFEYVQKSPVNGLLLAGMTFEVDGPLELTMKMQTPNPILDELLSQDWVIGMVLSPKALDNPEQLGTSTAGAGEYILDEDQTVAGDRYVYTANPDYYDADAVHFKTLTIQVIANNNSILSALKTGEIDAALGDFTTAQGARSANLQVVAQPTVWQGLALFDRAGSVSKPLGDVRVRQAINYAIDREAIAKALYAGDGLPASQIALPGSEDYNEDTADLYAYDPDKARELLAEAGYADGFTVEAASTSFANIGLAGQAVAAQLDKVGIELELKEKDVNAYFQDVITAATPVAVVGLGSPPMHISAGVELLPTGPFNPFKTENRELTELYTQAASAEPQGRAELNQQITALVQEEAWFAPVTYTPVYVYGSQDLGGLIVNKKNRVLNPVEIFSTKC